MVFAFLYCSNLPNVKLQINLFFVVSFLYFLDLLSFLHFVLFSFQGTFGGLKWARTTDLSLIRRVL